MNALNGHDKYGRAALDRECIELASLAHGRNPALNRSAFAMGSLIAAGLLDRREVEQRLYDASETNGHVKKRGPLVTQRTIASGIESGLREPRAIPEPTRSNGASRPRQQPQPQPTRPQELRPKPQLSGVPIPVWTEPGVDGKPPLVAVGLAELRPLNGEVRRHAYRRDGEVIRLKIKKADGWLDCYRVRRPGDGALGWQTKKPAGFVPMPYQGPAGAIDGFDPELLGETLWWCEGERDADTLQALGLAAFTFGSASDVPPCADLLRGRDLIVLGDHDEAGEKGIVRKVEMARGVASRIRVVRFPELPVGGDVSNF